MYHAIVRRKVAAVFDAVSHGYAKPVFDMMAPTFEHVFLGDDHALGGARTSLAQVRAWYARLYRLMPDIRFRIDRLAVAGPPWRTLVVVEWRETNSGIDGVTTSATGCHLVELAWGKVVRMVIAPDLRVLTATLQRLSAKGVGEATAPPITG